MDNLLNCELLAPLHTQKIFVYDGAMRIKRNQQIVLSALFAAAFLFGFFACEAHASGGSSGGGDAGAGGGVDPSEEAGASISRYLVTFSASTATVELDNLVNQDVYLVKINKSASNVGAALTGSAASSSQASGSQASASQALPDDTSSPQENVLMMDSPQALLWKPGEALWEAERARQASNAALSVGDPARVFTPAVVGGTKKFWVNDYSGGGAVWQEIAATLRAQGTYCNVWVADTAYEISNIPGNSKINSAQAETLKDKFDILYPLETNLFGYEFGGDPSGSNYGGRDGDPRIQIFVYKTEQQNLGGYFWSKDYFLQADLGTTTKTNYAEIFYLNSYLLDQINPGFIYSALAHEFQHMINFNMKGIRHRLTSLTWYDEMLSMLAEDVMDSFIGIAPDTDGHPILQRMPGFLATYNDYALEEWVSGIAAVYPKNYAFGAYLLRNYGGPALLQKMLANSSVNSDSISAALAEITPGMNFQGALDRYGEAMVFSGSGQEDISFNHAITETVKGKQYKLSAIDIWNMTRKPPEGTGPKLYAGQVEVKGHSVQLQRIGQGVNGDFSVTLTKPVSPYIDLYVMTRDAANP
jgi:hypothetical protein